MDIKDLKAKMGRARAVLGLEGQTVLKDRAIMRQGRDRTAAALKEIELDPRVKDAQALLANEGFRQEVTQALQITEKEKQAAAAMEVLKKNQVDVPVPQETHQCP